jgi:hypothetical protein
MEPDAMSDDVETVRSVATATVAANTTVTMVAIDDDDAGTESAYRVPFVIQAVRSINK